MVFTWGIERILLIMLEVLGILCAIIVLFIIGALFFIMVFECVDNGSLGGCIVCGCISFICFSVMVINVLKLLGFNVTKNDETSSSAETPHSECDIQKSTEECTIEINGQMYEIMPIQ